MKLVLALATALLMLGGASSADAWWFGTRLPKPIDSPRVRPKLREDHKVGKKQRHPEPVVQRLVPADSARA